MKDLIRYWSLDPKANVGASTFRNVYQVEVVTFGPRSFRKHNQSLYAMNDLELQERSTVKSFVTLLESNLCCFDSLKSRLIRVEMGLDVLFQIFKTH